MIDDDIYVMHASDAPFDDYLYCTTIHTHIYIMYTTPATTYNFYTS